MSDAEETDLTLNLGYITPPLSPTKTISTEGWLSPKTPVSPRKMHHHLSFLDSDVDPFLSTPPESPIKGKETSRFTWLQLQSSDPIKPFPQFALSPPSEDEADNQVSNRNDDDGGQGEDLHLSTAVSRVRIRSLSDADIRSSRGSDSWSNGPLHRPATGYRSLLRSSGNKEAIFCLKSPVKASSVPSPSASTTSATHVGLHYTQPLTSPNTMKTPPLTRTLSPLPVRHASSPLRPSQWAARGGLIRSPRHQFRAPDRFVASRRPPNITRESFELNKPSERLINGRLADRGEISHTDPFRERLRRSVRMNEELRNLRETHTILTGRANPNRRGAIPSLRRGSLAAWNREVSAGAVWNVGGSSVMSDTVVGVPDGRGGLLGSGTNAPLYTSMFLSRPDPEAALEAYEKRLALALEVDLDDRILNHSAPSSSSTAVPSSPQSPLGSTAHVWKDSAWTRDGATTQTKYSKSEEGCANPTVQIVLDAPQLRDDYYCSLLAYSHTAQCLAVGLGNFVHLWSEHNGVDTPESLNALTVSPSNPIQHVTSLAFSSTQGGQAILAVGRADGRIALWSPLDSEPRFDATQPKAISCVSFRPSTVKRPSLRDRALSVPTEELLVGDEAGHIYFYSVEWPSETQSALFGWNGAMTLLARMAVHSQQICGLSWSVDGELFASGGNDNACYLFESKTVLQPPNHEVERADDSVNVRQGPNGESIYTVTPGRGAVLHIPATHAKHKWELHAAVKAIAFCPWQRGLLAIGGGSNDRCIHFYHTMSGACLATIDCAAQVTSLIWSQTRREIAATFGFAQPEHPYRIAVFAWPSCEQVVSVPWFDENRALFAVAYPGSADSAGTSADAETRARARAAEDGVWWRSVEEGCIVVAASDAAIRFHEIWTGGKKGVGGGPGLLGGSDILEDLHGIDKDGLMIR
ncbi:unnamed protein product [Periconia digitata]|uniref:WD40 repeat-like protein n=1 Tax=Periconia digitata TaxID=1303443 RepID=A0A9W4XVE0_9PLEO|nr:unnamed protein product [Periconia digitata]